ncbi:unnamed protein product, partial [Mesorhabditis spiculigera]
MYYISIYFLLISSGYAIPTASTPEPPATVTCPPAGGQHETGAIVLDHLLHKQWTVENIPEFSKAFREFLNDSAGIAELMASAKPAGHSVSDYPCTRNFTASLRAEVSIMGKRMNESLFTRSVQRSGVYEDMLRKLNDFFLKAIIAPNEISLSFACHHLSPVEMFQVYERLLNCDRMTGERATLMRGLSLTFKLVDQRPEWMLGKEEADDYENYKSNFFFLESSPPFGKFSRMVTTYPEDEPKPAYWLAFLFATRGGFSRGAVLRRLTYWAQQSNEKWAENILQLGQMTIKDLERIAFLSTVCQRVLGHEPDYMNVYNRHGLVAVAERLQRLLLAKLQFADYRAGMPSYQPPTNTFSTPANED